MPASTSSPHSSDSQDARRHCGEHHGPRPSYSSGLLIASSMSDGWDRVGVVGTARPTGDGLRLVLPCLRSPLPHPPPTPSSHQVASPDRGQLRVQGGRTRPPYATRDRPRNPHRHCGLAASPVSLLAEIPGGEVQRILAQIGRRRLSCAVAQGGSRRRRLERIEGHGINDAPVLAAVQVGVAMWACSSAAAAQAVDGMLTGDRIDSIDRIDRLADAMELARRSCRLWPHRCAERCRWHGVVQCRDDRDRLGAAASGCRRAAADRLQHESTSDRLRGMSHGVGRRPARERADLATGGAVFRPTPCFDNRTVCPSESSPSPPRSRGFGAHLGLGGLAGCCVSRETQRAGCRRNRPAPGCSAGVAFHVKHGWLDGACSDRANGTERSGGGDPGAVRVGTWRWWVGLGASCARWEGAEPDVRDGGLWGRGGFT